MLIPTVICVLQECVTFTTANMYINEPPLFKTISHCEPSLLASFLSYATTCTYILHSMRNKE